jgi:PhzF family phenazine biosynthesis protein
MALSWEKIMSVPSTVTILQVDAFSAHPFGGNPAAVCVLESPVDESWMQQVATEMNLSETAFLYPIEGGYHLRWFTPAAEVDLCGHATLASAHVLWQEGYLPRDAEARFFTRSGWLTATCRDHWITLDFPSQPVQSIDPSPELLKSLRGLQPISTNRGEGAEANYLVELPSADYVRSLQPDFALLPLLPAMGVIVTAPADEAGFDFVSRYFAPAVGINEDPVTGSAHCSLAPYWQAKLGKSTFWAKQVSSRQGILQVVLEGDRVLISGQAITVLRGTFLTPSVA